MTATAAVPDVALNVHSFGSARDRTFREALAAGYFPVVPPAVEAAVTADQRLTALLRAPRVTDTLGDVMDRALGEIVAGRPVDPQQLHDDLVDAHQRAEVEPHLMHMHAQMHRRAKDAWHGVILQQVPALLEGLRVELADVMAATRAAAADLDGLKLDDASAVAGATDRQRAALLALAPLAGRYERLRIAQQATLAVAAKPPAPVGSEVQPTWQEVFDTGVHEFSGVPPLPPGPSVARLLAVARRSDVWLPEVGELEDAFDRFRGRAPVVVKRTLASTGETVVVAAGTS
jgi:hypothetical protein